MLRLALKIREHWGPIFHAVIVMSVILIVFKLRYLTGDNELISDFVSDYGYGGIFLVSLVSGFNFLIPVPAISLLPLFTISGLNILLAVFLIILGTTLADITAYNIVTMGKQAVQSSINEHIFKRLEQLCLRHYWIPIIVLFLFAAFVPFPNEIILAPLAFLGYRLLHLLPALLLGNGIFNTLYALGVVNIFKA